MGRQIWWAKRYNFWLVNIFDNYRLEDYETLKPIMENFNIPKTGKVLNVGCGNSEFSEKMYDDGYTQNYNIDICQNVIDFMKKRNSNRKMVFEVMDVTNMSYKDETFDLIIDKSTIDTLLCGDHSYTHVATMTKEISRILKTGGIYFIISYGIPENRMFHLERDHLGFKIDIYKIKKSGNDQGDDEEEEPSEHYGYVCTKLETANENLKNFDLVMKELEQEELEDGLEEEEEVDNPEEQEEER